MVNTLPVLVLVLQLVNVSSLSAQPSSRPALTAQSNSAASAEEVPTIDFCEMVNHPQRYYDKTVRITAEWQSGFEFSYLSNERCPKSADNIAVRFVNDETPVAFRSYPKRCRASLATAIQMASRCYYRIACY
jgi:hypothetical protein